MVPLSLGLPLIDGHFPSGGVTIWLPYLPKYPSDKVQGWALYGARIIADEYMII